MRIRSDRSGTSLMDVTVTLALLAVIVTIASPGLISARALMSARAARDATAAEIERARTLAAARGTARVIVDVLEDRITIESPPGRRAREPLRLAASLGVDVTVDGAATNPVVLDFNAMGIGMVANRTIRFRQGDREARLSLSLYGRVRRW